jgi:hypothetical protein
MRQEARLRGLAWGACAGVIGLTVLIIALLAGARIGTSYGSSQPIQDSLPDLMITVAYTAVGVGVTLKRPANLVGWALVLAGVGLLAAGVASAYGELAVLARPDAGLPGGTVAAAFEGGSWTPLIAGVFLLLATFPSGELSTRRMRRWVLSVLSGFLVVWVLITLSSEQLSAPLQEYQNPLAVPGANVLAVCAIVVIAGCLASVVAAGVIVVRCFRRSRGLERQQFKWLASSAGLLVVTLPFAAAFNYSRVAGAVFTVELIALPVSVGIAVLRYRLYEIDLIVRRTLVYGALSVLLAGAYVAIVLVLQELFSTFAGGSGLAVAVSTLVVAGLFLPVRRRIQTLVDRRFYRRRYDAQRTLEEFGARLRDEVDLDALASDLRGVVTETVRPAHVSLWLREGAR